MAEFDRRTVMQGALTAGALLGLPRVAGAAAPRPSVVVVDPRFLPSAAFARHWRARGVAVVDTRLEDLGRAWRRRIPDLLAQPGASIAGMTLWSDLLICQMAAHGHGLALTGPPRRIASPAEPDLHHWALRTPD